MVEPQRSMPGWAELRTVPLRASTARFVLATAAASVPMAVQLHRTGYQTETIRDVVVISVLAAVVASRFRRFAALPAAAATALSVYRYPELPIALVGFLAVLAAAWVIATGCFGEGARWFRPPVVTLAIPGLLLTDAALVARIGLRLPIACTGLALVCVAVGFAVPQVAASFSRSVGPAATLGRRVALANRHLVDRVGHVLGLAIGTLLMSPSSVISLIGWVGQTIARFDPLDPPSGPGTRWVERSGHDPRPAAAFARTPVSDPDRSARSARRFRAGVVTTAMVLVPPSVVMVVPMIDDGGSETGGGAFGERPNPAMQDQPGWPEIGSETDDFGSRGRFDGSTTYSFPDFSGSFISERGGVRRGWAPPACNCRRVRIWWLGGSAAWGWYQRDQFSLPAQIAREAWKRGIALDIENRAMPGWVLGQEVRHFAELTTTARRPDLVMFYDGGNDLNTQKDRNAQGRGADESEISFAENEIGDVLANGPFAPRPRSTTTTTPGTAVTLAPVDVADHAMNRYRRSVDLATRFSRVAGVTPVFLWQPLLPSAPESAGNPDAIVPNDRAFWAEMLPAALRQLPTSVVDLSDSLDQVDRPVFTDVWHTNEHGAEVVAEQIVRQLEPTLRATAATPAADH